MDGSTGDVARALRRCQQQFPAEPVREELVFGFDRFVDTVREVIAEHEGSEEYRTVSELRAVKNQIDESVELKSSATFETIRFSLRSELYLI